MKSDFDEIDENEAEATELSYEEEFIVLDEPGGFMTVKDLKDALEDLPDDMEVTRVEDGCSISYVHDWWIEDDELVLG